MIEKFLEVKLKQKQLEKDVFNTDLVIFSIYSVGYMLLSMFLLFMINYIINSNITDIFQSLQSYISNNAVSKSANYWNIEDLKILSELSNSQLNNIHDEFRSFFLFNDSFDVNQITNNMNIFTKYGFVIYFSIMTLASFLSENKLFKDRFYFYAPLNLVFLMFFSFILFIKLNTSTIISESYYYFESYAMLNLNLLTMVEFLSIVGFFVFFIFSSLKYKKINKLEHNKNIEKLNDIKEESKEMKKTLFKNPDNFKDVLEIYKKEQDDEKIKIIESILDEYKEKNKEKFKRINEFEKVLCDKNTEIKNKKKNNDILIENE